MKYSKEFKEEALKLSDTNFRRDNTATINIHENGMD